MMDAGEKVYSRHVLGDVAGGCTCKYCGEEFENKGYLIRHYNECSERKYLLAKEAEDAERAKTQKAVDRAVEAGDLEKIVSSYIIALFAIGLVIPTASPRAPYTDLFIPPHMLPDEFQLYARGRTAGVTVLGVATTCPSTGLLGLLVERLELKR